MALATDRVGTLGKDRCAITSQNVITTQEVAAIVTEGLSIRCGSRGTPSHRCEGVRDPANGACTILMLRNIDEYHSKLYLE